MSLSLKLEKEESARRDARLLELEQQVYAQHLQKMEDVKVTAELEQVIKATVLTFYFDVIQMAL